MKREGNAQPSSKPNGVAWPIVYCPKVFEPSPQLKIEGQVLAGLSQSNPVELRARNMLPSFTFSPELVTKLQAYISKGQEKCGVMFGTAPSRSKRAISFCLEYANTILGEEEDIHTKICQ